jgi:hypothetical protein
MIRECSVCSRRVRFVFCWLVIYGPPSIRNGVSSPQSRPINYCWSCDHHSQTLLRLPWHYKPTGPSRSAILNLYVKSPWIFPYTALPESSLNTDLHISSDIMATKEKSRRRQRTGSETSESALKKGFTSEEGYCNSEAYTKAEACAGTSRATGAP